MYDDEKDDDLLRVLRDPLLWGSGLFEGPMDIATPFAVMEAEDAAAASVLDEILTGPWTAWPERLRKANLRTAGMVRQLLERRPAVIERQPAAALQLTSMALALAEVLDPRQYWHDEVTYLCAQALREQAHVLSFMGRSTEALRYVERSARAFASLDPALIEWDMARLQLVKAVALRLLERGGEAVALAHDAGEKFLQAGDRPRFVQARITEAAMLYDAGAVENALSLWRSVQGDRDLGAVDALRLTHNIALCLCDLGRGEEAIAPLRHCVSEFGARGLDTERTRSRWYLGNALLGAARSDEAIAALRTASREFAELDLPVDAALAALHLAEALVANEQPEEVPAICREVIAQLTNAGLAMQAIPALSLLREAAAMGDASRALIRQTHATLRSAGREEARLRAALTTRAG